MSQREMEAKVIQELIAEVDNLDWDAAYTLLSHYFKKCNFFALLEFLKFKAQQPCIG